SRRAQSFSPAGPDAGGQLRLGIFQTGVFGELCSDGFGAFRSGLDTGAFPSSRSTTNNLKGVTTPMTDLKIALMELLRKYQPDQDMLREGLQLLAEALMELEVTQKVGAGRYERTSQRTNYRNGYRLRNWDTRVGTIALRIPRLRQGATSPASWSHAGGPNGPCCPSSRRLTSTASAPGRWTTWFRPWAWKASARVRSPASARSWTRRWPSSATAPWTGSTPTCGWMPRRSRPGRTTGW